jgi:hypothetical protein
MYEPTPPQLPYQPPPSPSEPYPPPNAPGEPYAPQAAHVSAEPRPVRRSPMAVFLAAVFGGVIGAGLVGGALYLFPPRSVVSPGLSPIPVHSRSRRSPPR